MTLVGFLRRKAIVTYSPGLTQTYYEYLFFPIIDNGLKFNGSKIAPTLPANNASTLTGIVEGTGARGLNFQLDIGMQRVQFSISGDLQDILSTDVPAINGTADIPPTGSGKARYMNRGYSAVRTTDITAMTDPGLHVRTAENLRDHLLIFTADQSFIDSLGNVEYTEFCFGYPNWNVSDVTTQSDIAQNVGSPPIDQTIDQIAGTDYRIWYGMIDGVDFSESAGVQHQFPYKFNFNVGVPVI